MQQISLEAKVRTEKGKSAVRNSRKNGVIPGVIYGKKTDSISLSLQIADFEKALHQGAAHKIVNLKIKDAKPEEKLCVIHEIQRDTFGIRVLHVDFHHISMEEKITAKVPIELKGQPASLKAGGVLDHVLWEVEVEALPLNLPEKLEGDVSALLINQAVHVKDIVLPPGVKILEDPEEVVAVVHPPRTEEVAAATLEEAALPGVAPTTPTQPEVISKGKKEEEEPAPEKPEKPEKVKK